MRRKPDEKNFRHQSCQEKQKFKSATQEKLDSSSAADCIKITTIKNMKAVEQSRTARMTGGGSGIGFAIAEKFIKRNITTTIVGRDEQKLHRAKEKLGDLCKPLCFDLTNLTAIPALINEIEKTYGDIDILVNNAGINMKKEFAEVTDEEFQRILLTNVTSAFALSREVVKKC